MNRMIGVVLLFALVAAACGDDEPVAPTAATTAAPTTAAPTTAAPTTAAAPTTQAPGELEIGVLTVLSGPAAVFAVAMNNALEIKADEVNAEGGLLVGDRRYEIKLVFEDTRYELPLIKSLSEKLILNEGIRFIINPGDPTMGAIQPLTDAERVIQMGTTFDLEPCKGQFSFCFLSTPQETAPHLFEAISARNPDAKRFVTASVNLLYDTNTSEWVTAAGEAAGFENGGNQLWEATTTDFQPVATGILAKDPDVVVIGGLGGDIPPIVRALREQGYEGLITSSWSVISLPQLLEAFEGEEDLIEGYLAIEPQTYPFSPETQALSDEYQSRTGDVWGTNLNNYYYEITFLLEAIQRAGTVDDTAAIAAELENVSLPYKFFPNEPVISFGGTSKLGRPHQAQVPMGVNVITNGQLETIDVIIASVP